VWDESLNTRKEVAAAGKASKRMSRQQRRMGQAAERAAAAEEGDKSDAESDEDADGNIKKKRKKRQLRPSAQARKEMINVRGLHPPLLHALTLPQDFGISVASSTTDELRRACWSSEGIDRVTAFAALVSSWAMVLQCAGMVLGAATVEMLRLEPGWLTGPDNEGVERLRTLFDACRTDMDSKTHKACPPALSPEEHRATAGLSKHTPNMLLARRAVVAAGKWPLPAQDTLLQSTNSHLAERAFEHYAGLAERMRGMVARGVRKLCDGDKTYAERVLHVLMHTSLPDQDGVAQYRVRNGDARLQLLVARRDELFTEARQQLRDRSEGGWHSTPDEMIRGQRGVVAVHLFSAWAAELSGEEVLGTAAPSFVELFVPSTMGQFTSHAAKRQRARARWVTENAGMLATEFNTPRLERSGLRLEGDKWVADEELLLPIARFNEQFAKRHNANDLGAFGRAAQDHSLDFLETLVQLKPNGWGVLGIGAACMPTARLSSDGWRLRWDYCDLRRPRWWARAKEDEAPVERRYLSGERVWDECRDVVDSQERTLWWRRLEQLTIGRTKRRPAPRVSTLAWDQKFTGNSTLRTAANQGGLGGACCCAG
jgi:hypothetical protein